MKRILIHSNSNNHRNNSNNTNNNIMDPDNRVSNKINKHILQSESIILLEANQPLVFIEKKNISFKA